MKFDISTYFKGMAMGAADVVPGVSGGTIAFITGIYETLLESIRRCNPMLIKHVKEHGLVSAWKHINGTFLVTLLAGILTSIVLFAGAITWLLKNQPIAIWSFFFGLIMTSIMHLVKQLDGWKPGYGILMAAGIMFSYSLSQMTQVNMDPSLLTVLLAGMVAICAMILPGISGSFILLLLGMYAPVLAAVKGFDIPVLATFAVGCVLGLMLFSHLLSWLLKRYHGHTLVFLTGLMAGTLAKVWPWKQVIEWRINSSGEEVPLREENLLPFNFEAVTGESSQLAVAIACFLLGVGLVLALEKLGERES